MNLLPIGIGLGKAALSGFNYMMQRKKKAPDFATTEYGKFLEKLSQSGKYSPQTMRKILSGAGAEISNVVQTDVAKRRGFLARNRMDRSIAGGAFLAEPERYRAEELRKTKVELDIENEMSKLSAAEKYNLMRYQTNEQNRLEGKQNVSDLISGFGGAIDIGIATYKIQKDYESEMAYKQGRISKEEKDAADAQSWEEFKIGLSKMSAKDRVRAIEEYQRAISEGKY